MKYKELAEMYEDQKSLLFTQLDGTSNDLLPEFVVRNYPTLFLSRANNKTRVLVYSGPRETGPLKKFIEQSVSIPLSATAANAKPKPESSSALDMVEEDEAPRQPSISSGTNKPVAAHPDRTDL